METGIYWTPPLPSAKFRNSMSVYDPERTNIQVYIDDLLYHGQEDDDCLKNSRDIRISRDNGVTTNCEETSDRHGHVVCCSPFNK